MSKRIEFMTKEDIIRIVQQSNCKMMFGLPLYSMSKQEIIEYLKKSCCPVLKKLLRDEK